MNVFALFPSILEQFSWGHLIVKRCLLERASLANTIVEGAFIREKAFILKRAFLRLFYDVHEVAWTPGQLRINFTCTFIFTNSFQLQQETQCLLSLSAASMVYC